MTFEEFQKATPDQLKAAAASCFEVTEGTTAWDSRRAPSLLEAQFYMQEIDRREDAKIAYRDYKMEWVVIGLIGLEIVLAIGLAVWGNSQQNNDVQQELQEFQKMQDVLSNLQDSSKATATTMATLESTSETMNQALQKELALSYDVMLVPTYDSDSQKIIFTNNGRSSVVLYGWKIEGLLRSQDNPRTIVAGTSFGGPIADVAKFLTTITQNGVDRLVPFEVYVRNERQEEFTISANFAMSWHDGKLQIGTQTVEIIPDHWSRRLKLPLGAPKRPSVP